MQVSWSLEERPVAKRDLTVYYHNGLVDLFIESSRQLDLSVRWSAAKIQSILHDEKYVSGYSTTVVLGLVSGYSTYYYGYMGRLFSNY